MGLYGSPDLSNKYGDPNKFNKANKNRKRKNILLIVFVIFNILSLLLLGPTEENILYLVLLDCVIVFIYSIGKLIYNLITKKSPKNSVIAIIVSFILFNVVSFSIMMQSNVLDDVINQNSEIKSQFDNEVKSKGQGTRQSSAKMGEIHQLKVTDILGLDCIIEIELLEVMKKDDALDMTKDLYTFVSLKDNQEYLFAKFRVKNIKNNSDKDIPFSFNWSNFSYATGEYKKYNYTMGLMSGGDLLESVDLYEGAEHEGWICLYVEKEDSQPKAIFLDRIWFDL